MANNDLTVNDFLNSLKAANESLEACKKKGKSILYGENAVFCAFFGECKEEAMAGAMTASEMNLDLMRALTETMPRTKQALTDRILSEYNEDVQETSAATSSKERGLLRSEMVAEKNAMQAALRVLGPEFLSQFPDIGHKRG